MSLATSAAFVCSERRFERRVALGNGDVRVSDIAAIASGEAGVRIDDVAREHIAAGCEALRSAIARSGHHIYGVSTGVGDSVRNRST